MRGGVDVLLIVAGDLSCGVDAEGKDEGHAGESEHEKSPVAAPHEAVEIALRVNVEAGDSSGIVDATGNHGGCVMRGERCDGAIRGAHEGYRIVRRTRGSGYLASGVDAHRFRVLPGLSEERGKHAVWTSQVAVEQLSGIAVRAGNRSGRIDADRGGRGRAGRIESDDGAIRVSQEGVRPGTRVAIIASNSPGGVYALWRGPSRSGRVERD